jgi:threonine dehydrogenase-like Zn-dependent dehydrogenase
MEEPRFSAHAADVLVRIVSTGMCATDDEIRRAKHGYAPEGAGLRIPGWEEFLITGHEVLGQVERVPRGVHHIRERDLVAMRVRDVCPHGNCAPCRRGQAQLCETFDYTESGINTHGFNRELILYPARMCHVIPRHVGRRGLLVEPLTVVEHATRRALEIMRCKLRSPDWQPGGAKALVIAPGTIGNLFMLVLRQHGMEVIGVGRKPDDPQSPRPKVQLFRDLGGYYDWADDKPDDAAGSRGRRTLEELAVILAEQRPLQFRRTSGDPRAKVDFIFDCSTSSFAFHEAIRHFAAPNCVAIGTSITGGQKRYNFALDDFMCRATLQNWTVDYVVNASPDDFTAAITRLTEDREPEITERFLTHCFAGIGQTEQALDHIGLPNVIKAYLRISDIV